MAQLRQKKGIIKAPEAPAAEGATDLDVLHPNRSATIAGRAVVVREYGFIEGMQMLALLEPLLADLKRMLEHEQPLSLQSVTALIAPHMDLITDAVATAADVEPEWIAGLGQEDGYHLLMLWWGANGPFYIRTARNRMFAERVARDRMGAGQTSTPPSSPPATETPSESAG